MRLKLINGTTELRDTGHKGQGLWTGWRAEGNGIDARRETDRGVMEGRDGGKVEQVNRSSGVRLASFVEGCRERAHRYGERPMTRSQEKIRDSRPCAAKGLEGTAIVRCECRRYEGGSRRPSSASFPPAMRQSPARPFRPSPSKSVTRPGQPHRMRHQPRDQGRCWRSCSDQPRHVPSRTPGTRQSSRAARWEASWAGGTTGIAEGRASHRIG